MGHGKYIDPFRHADAPACHSERSEESVFRVAAGESLNLQYVVLPGESRDIDVNIDLVGPGAQAHVKVLYLSGGEEQVNIRILMHHRAPGCHSTQKIHGIAGGRARIDFHGTIVVAPDAQKTEAYQDADDVKCSHGATVGQLNVDELFYMRSRGIPEAEARTLQMLSFLSPVIPQGREQEVETAVRSL